MARTKTQIILRYGLYGLVGVGLAGIFTYFFVIRTIQIHNQKQNFAKAEVQLDVLGQQIQTKVGKPNEQEKYNYCQYVSLEYAKGPRTCVASIYNLFSNTNYETANELMNKARPLLGSSFRNLYGKPSDQFVSYGELATQSFVQNGATFGEVSCTTQYTYPAKYFSPSPFKITSDENFLIVTSCSGPAMGEFFPVKN